MNYLALPKREQAALDVVEEGAHGHTPTEVDAVFLVAAELRLETVAQKTVLADDHRCKDLQRLLKVRIRALSGLPVELGEALLELLSVPEDLG